MNIEETLRKINFLRNELNYFLPLDPETEKNLWNKICLDWNYHSCNMERIHLTFEETQDAMRKHGKIPGLKVRGSSQAQGHDNAIAEIRAQAKADRPFTEHFIRNLHGILIQESYYNPAITLDGKATEKKVIPGEYKSVPNWFKKHGKIHSYASVEETPGMMTDLTDWCNEQMSKTDMHPLIIAAEYHFRFIRIHPFDDGNGRTARLLVNYILMRLGFPPVIIKTSDKDRYIEALNKGDKGEKGSLDDFFLFLGDLLIRSLEMYLDVARGGKTHEKGDLQKRILLFTKKIENDYMKIHRSNQEILNALESAYFPMLREVDNSLKLFDTLFSEKGWRYYNEPQPPDYGVDIVARSGSLPKIIDHFTRVGNAGDSFHQFKIFNWLTDLRMKGKDINVEVAFEMYCFDFEYKIIAHVGMPLESGTIVSGLKDFVTALTGSSGDTSPFEGFEYTICHKEYGSFPSQENITEWAEDLGHKLMSYIEGKAKLNPHKELQSDRKNFLTSPPRVIR